jgi:membrane protein DedA with SNARE-associated domain
VNLYAAIFLATLSTTVLPVPEEATLLGAGYAARLGDVTLLGAIAAGLLACLVGDVASYWVGRLFLARLLRTKIGQRLVPERRRAWAEALVKRSSGRAIVLARFLVGLRGFVYFAVGASRVPFARFALVDAAAGLVEVGGLVAVGFAFGVLRNRVAPAGVAREIDLAVAALLVATFAAPLVARWVTSRAPSRR